MANPALGGILQGLMAGWERGDQKTREQTNDRRVAEEYDYAKGRRGVVDAQQDNLYGLGLEDRERKIKIEDKREGRADVDWSWLQSEREHLKNRRPIEEAQTDEIRGLGIAQTKQQMAQSEAQHVMNMRSAAMRAEMDRIGLTDEKLNLRTKQVQRALFGSLATAEVTGNMAPVVEAMNATIGKDHGYQIRDIKRQQDGSFTVDYGGDEPMVFQSIDALGDAVMKLTNPETYAQIMLSRTPAGTEKPPAQVATADAVYARMRQMDQYKGVPDSDLWIAAFDKSQETKDLSLEARLDSFYTQTLHKLLPPGASEKERAGAEAAAEQMTARYADRFSGSAAPAGGGLGLGAAMPQAAAGPQGRPTGAGASQQQGVPPAEGTRVRGRDGKEYIVRGGVPVPIGG